LPSGYKPHDGRFAGLDATPDGSLDGDLRRLVRWLF
jgi:hypothetical protein